MLAENESNKKDDDDDDDDDYDDDDCDDGDDDDDDDDDDVGADIHRPSRTTVHIMIWQDYTIQIGSSMIMPIAGIILLDQCS